MWWLDHGPLAGIPPESDPPNPPQQASPRHLHAIQLHVEETNSESEARVISADAHDEPPSERSQASDEASELLRQLVDAETERCLAAETQLADASVQHAEQLAALRLQIQRLEESGKKSEATYSELAATIDQRDAIHAEQVAELKQARQDSEAALQKSESQRAAETQSLQFELESLQESLKQNEVVRSDLEARIEQRDSAHATELAAWTRQTESLQSNLQTLEQRLAESESARDDLQAAITQCDATLAAQLVEAEQALESAAVRADELAAKLISLEGEAATLQSRLDTEVEERAVSDCELEECRTVHAAEITSLQEQLQALRLALGTNEALRRDTEVVAEQREAECSLALDAAGRAREAAEQRANQLAARLAAMEIERAALQVNLEQEIQGHLISEIEWRELERQHASQTETLQAAIVQRDATFANQLVEAEQAREIAVVRANELSAQLLSLEEEAATRQSRLDTEIKGRVAAGCELEQCRAVHAAELVSLQTEIQTLRLTLDTHEELRRESEAAAERREVECSLVVVEAGQARVAAEQRANQLAARLAAAEVERAALQVNLEQEIQEHLTSEAGRRELERQHASQTEYLQSKLLNLEKLVRENEAARLESNAVLMRSNEEHAAELAKSNETRQAAEQRSKELDRQQQSLQCQLESSSARAGKESETRVAAETALRRLADEFRQLSDEAEKTRDRYQDLLRHSAEQRDLHVTNAVQLQQEVDDRERQLRERNEQIARQASEFEHRRESEQRIQLENEQLSTQQAEQIASLESQVAELRSQAEAERAARIGVESVEMRNAQTRHTERVASLEEIKHLRQQLQEAIQCHKDEQENRQRAEALVDSLAKDIALQQKRVEAFRGFAQREAAARKKLETAIKRSGDGAESGASLLAIRANIEVNERIRRLTTELTATRNQELSVRQRAMQEIKRAQEEVQRLKDQLAKERKAA